MTLLTTGQMIDRIKTGEVAAAELYPGSKKKAKVTKNEEGWIVEAGTGETIVLNPTFQKMKWQMETEAETQTHDYKVIVSVYDGGSVEYTLTHKPDEEKIVDLTQKYLGDNDDFSFTQDVVERDELSKNEEYTLLFTLSADMEVDGSITICKALPEDE